MRGIAGGSQHCICPRQAGSLTCWLSQLLPACTPALIDFADSYSFPELSTEPVVPLPWEPANLAARQALVPGGREPFVRLDHCCPSPDLCSPVQLRRSAIPCTLAGPCTPVSDPSAPLLSTCRPQSVWQRRPPLACPLVAPCLTARLSGTHCSARWTRSIAPPYGTCAATHGQAPRPRVVVAACMWATTSCPYWPATAATAVGATAARSLPLGSGPGQTAEAAGELPLPLLLWQLWLYR